ncbi:GNAT family N-acetyltransferase [Gordonia hirsuta]|nr:GNAT family N-acetyltransferase [Gordonia hirsuta]
MPDETSLVIEIATDPVLAARVAFLAAVTFPLACPAHSTREDMAGHIAAALTPQRFADWIDDDSCEVIVAREGEDGPLVGYALVIHTPPTDHDVCAAVGDALSSEVSKMYVLPGHHGTHRADRPAHRLMDAAVRSAQARGSQVLWLGVNQLNERAQRYYRKMGFTQAGTRTFQMSGAVENDYVMTRRI